MSSLRTARVRVSPPGYPPSLRTKEGSLPGGPTRRAPRGHRLLGRTGAGVGGHVPALVPRSTLTTQDSDCIYVTLFCPSVRPLLVLAQSGH